MRQSAKVAFTLVELLVVVTIIGLLSALLLSAISSAKARGCSAVCKNHLRQMGLGLQMYVDENAQRYPHWVNPYAPEFNDAVGPVNTRYWWAKLLPYYPVNWLDKAYHCPGYKGAIAGEISPRPPLGSYAYNGHGVRPAVAGLEDPSRGVSIRFPPANFGLGPAYRRGAPWRAVSEAQIVAPSEMLAIGESRFLNKRVNGYLGGECDLESGHLNFPYNGAGDEYAFGEKRHGERYNQLFCDGHVSAMDPWILFDPRKSASMWNYDNQPHPELWWPSEY